MPEARAPFLISEFLKGYEEGSARSQAARLQRAQGLMQMAQMHAKQIETTTDPEIRAMAGESMNKAMAEAEKIMKGSDGIWSQLSKLIFNKKKGEMQDPVEALKQFGIQPGGTYEQGTMRIGAAPQTKEQPAQPSGLSAPPQSAPAGNDFSGMGGMPEQAPAPTVNKDGVPIERPAPESLGGVTTPTIPDEAVVGRPRPPIGTEIKVPIYKPPEPAKPPKGVKTEAEATGEGLEAVMNAKGHIDYRLKGQSISLGRYNDLADRMAIMGMEQGFRKEERSEQFKQELEQLTARAKAQEASNARTAEAYKIKVTGGTRPMSKAEENNYNYIAFGAKPTDTKLDIQKFNRVDPATGDHYETWKYIDPQTGKVLPGEGPVPDVKMPPNEMGIRIQGIMAAKGVDYPTAVSYLARDLESDEQVQKRMKNLQIEGLATKNAMDKMEKETKEKNAKGEFTKQQYIERAYKESKEWIKATNPQDMTVAFTALKDHMLQAYGIQWDDFTAAIGQPSQIYQDLANQYLGKTGSQMESSHTPSVPSGGSTTGQRIIPR